MTCEELLAALNDYIDDESMLAVCTEFAEHLAGCNPCQIVVDNIRKSIQLYQSGEPYPLPAEFSQKLHDTLKTKWLAKFNEAR